MTQWPNFIDPADLAPGDRTPHPKLPEGLRAVTVRSPGSAEFELAYSLLDDYFGKAGEMETREVIAKRLEVEPEKPVGGYAMLYHLTLLFARDECVGVRDHTAIMSEDFSDAVVHLSHVLVLPKFRRRGLSAIMRTLPINTAKECAKRAGRAKAPVTLLCEMEPKDLTVLDNKIRRTSYEKASFKALGSALGYAQPDFRKASQIDADPLGTKPIPFDILLRRVGRENDSCVSEHEVISCVELIYAMYSHSFRFNEMQPCLQWLDEFSTRGIGSYPLYPPTKAP